ncbi:MAG: ferritin-like domain-containing protein [Mycobacteriales bacterium]
MTPRPTRRAVLLAGAALAVVRPTSALAAPADDVAALNALLAVEHAAIYDLAAAGGTLSLVTRAVVVRHYDEHRARRDVLTQRIRVLGGAPVAALPAYADPVLGPDGTADIVAVEAACVQAYHAAIGSVADQLSRRICATAFIDECRHLALAKSAGGQAGAPDPFVTGR